jgi:hypothetical protein
MSLKDRRNFLKTIGLGTAIIPLAITGKPAFADNDNRQPYSETEHLPNGFNFEFMFSGNNFLGIGQIKYNGVLLRNNRLPMFAQISTPEAVELVNYKLIDKLVNENEILLTFSVQKKYGNTMEWMLHTVRNRRNMTDWAKGPEDVPDTKVVLKIKPVVREIGESHVAGFSYQYFFESESLSIYKITDRASWEVAGTAMGNELWMRNGVVEPIKEFNKISDFYSTEWYLPGISNPNIFQFHPLQTHLQGFTFTSSAMGSLITFPQKVSHIRTLIEKWRDSDAIVHFHEHCGDLANSFETSPVEVYFIPGQLDRAGRSNLYHQVKEKVHDELHAQIGMKRERITTYGIIEEWTEPDFDNYTHHILPKLIQTGVKTVFITNQCQNDMNTWGVSNMCCNVDFKISETVGEDKLKAFCQKARNNGAKVEMWGNTAISTLTERFMYRDGKEKGVKFLPYKGSIMEVINKSESPFVRNPSNAIEADHYTPRFCALNLRDKDIRDYWMKQWKYFHDELGIEGIFLDSSFNMSSDKFHHAQFDKSKNWGGATLDQKDLQRKYRPEIEPPKLIQSQYHAHLEWVVEMQKMGYQYSAEDLGVFGINRTGPSVANRIPSLSIWSDSFCDFNEDEVKNLGYEPLEIFFKGLAYRMMWKINWNFKKQKIDLGIENPVAYELLKVYNEVTDLMYNREILPEENGVIYRLGKTSVLWAFADFEYKHDNPLKITEMVLGDSVQPGKKETLQAQKLNVYKLEYSA